MKERGSKRPTEDILGIKWPKNSLDSETLNYIVKNPDKKPLRVMIARQIIKEGEKLLEELGLQSSNEESINKKIAISEGFMAAGSLILKAEAYYMDREGYINKQINAVKNIQEMTDTPHKQAVKEAQIIRFTRIALGIKKQQTIKSLDIDPKGFHFLEKGHAFQMVIWEKTFGSKNDPEVLGLRVGIDRYKKLYKETENAGATPDTNSFMKRLRARFRRIPN